MITSQTGNHQATEPTMKNSQSTQFCRIKGCGGVGRPSTPSADSPVHQSISTPQSSEVPQQTEDFIAARNQLYDEKFQLEEENHLISKEHARLQEEVNFLNTKIKLLEELWPKAIYEVAQIQHGAEKLEDDGWVQPKKQLIKSL